MLLRPVPAWSRPAVLWVGLAGCWQPTGQVDYMVSSPPSAPASVAGILSAHFSRDAQRDREPADAIVLVFDRELDATSLMGRAFMVVMSDGSRVRAAIAVFANASEDDENRSVTLWGDFGEPSGRIPTDVVIIERIWDERGGPLLGASAKISAYEDGPRLVAMRGAPADAGACGGSAQIIRTYWSDDVLDVGDDDLAHIDVELADGRSVHPTGFDDTLGNGTDISDDNVLELCLSETVAARSVRIVAGSFAGPAGWRTGPTRGAVSPASPHE